MDWPAAQTLRSGVFHKKAYPWVSAYIPSPSNVQEWLYLGHYMQATFLAPSDHLFVDIHSIKARQITRQYPLNHPCPAPVVFHNPLGRLWIKTMQNVAQINMGVIQPDTEIAFNERSTDSQWWPVYQMPGMRRRFYFENVCRPMSWVWRGFCGRAAE